MPTYLAILLWNLRNVLARYAADCDPTGYDTCYEPGDGAIGTAPDAYAAIGADGFRLYGAFGTVRDESCDPLTGATGFGPHGEALGLREYGTESAFDAEAELHATRLRLEYLDNASEVVRLSADERDEQAELTERADALVYADGGPSEGMVSTEDMNVPYWQECADSHVADMEKAERMSASGYTFPTTRDIAARRNIDAAEGRVKRLESYRKALQRAVSKYRTAHHSGTKGAGQAVLNDIGTWVAKVQTTAQESYRDCKRSGDWAALYLTSEQVEAFGLYVRRARRAIEVVRAQPVCTQATRMADVAANLSRTISDLAATRANMERLSHKRA